MDIDEQTACSESYCSEAKDSFHSFPEPVLKRRKSMTEAPRRVSIGVSTTSTQPLSETSSNVSYMDEEEDYYETLGQSFDSYYDSEDSYSEEAEAQAAMFTHTLEQEPLHRRLSKQGSSGGCRSGNAKSSEISSRNRSSNCSMSEVSSSEWSSDYDSDEEEGEYDDVIATMQHSMASRVELQGLEATIEPARESPGLPPAAHTAGGASAPGLPVTLPLVPPVMPGMPPSEGLDLSMLASLRNELQKVGDMITKNKEGEKFLKRAHILASINMLASNLPTCVVDHLGQEIRNYLSVQESLKNGNNTMAQKERQAALLISDGSSEASDLSYDEMDYKDEAEEDDRDTFGDSDSDSEYSSSGYLRTKRTNFKVSSIGSSGEDTSTCSASVATCCKLDKFVSKYDRKGTKSNDAKSMCSGVSRSTTTSSEEDNGILPAAAYFQGSLLFVDISGFTKLSTVLDPEILSKVINAYFQKIVDIVDQFGGDIQKFAGDALFAEWRAVNGSTLEQCVAAAASCATAMVVQCANFPVLSVVSSKEVVSLGATSLDVHCGVGVGDMTGIHVGDNKNRREYLYIGDAIDQATKACDESELGEAIASTEFYEIISQIGVSIEAKNNQKTPRRIAAASVGASFDVSAVWCPTTVRNARSRGVTDQVDGLQVDALIEYRRLMSLYVHPVVVSNDVAAANNFKSSKVQGCAKERIREEAELRSVYVMFVKLNLPVQVTGNKDTDGEGIHMLNDVMNLVTKKLNHYKGHLRQFIVDDKGYVMIVTFGLRGSTFPKMVSERALPATLLIRQALHMELGVESTIGATIGDVYCGAVGGEKRNEYAVLGPSVNLAARLMCSKDNPGVLVDKGVRQLAMKPYCFNALEPIVAKGYKDPVPIFEPLDYIERKWGQIEPNFVGRKREMTKIVQIAEEMAGASEPASKLVLVNAPSGMGKTSLLSHSIEHIRRRVGWKPRALVLAKHAVRDSEMLLAFSTICALVRDALASYANQTEDTTCMSRQSIQALGCERKTEANGRTDLSEVQGDMLADLLVDIGTESGVSQAVIDYTTRYIRGGGKEAPREKKRPSPRHVAAFFLHIFLRCIEDTDLAIIAIDDIHRVDEMSWVVLRRVLEHADNVLILGATSIDITCFRIPNGFLDDLDEEYAPRGCFVEVVLEPLSKEEMTCMAMKILGLQRSEILPELMREVITQSAGMPQFANRVLEGIKERYFMGTNHSMSTESDEALAEIIIHRIDSLDVEVRSTLNVAAVLGFVFTLGQVVSVLQESSDAKNASKNDFLKKSAEAIQVALQEGVLLVRSGDVTISEGAALVEFDLKDETIEFQFSQEIWHTTLLKLMLDSRKRDIHRKLATALAKTELRSLECNLSIFKHWLASGSTEETTKYALLVGDILSAMPARRDECFKIYEDALDTFGWVKPALRGESGFSDQVLLWLPAGAVSNVVNILVALGKAFTAASRHHDATASYENALRVMQKARFSHKITDRSVLFPAFIGLSDAIAEGHVQQDANCCYEQAMLQKYLMESRIHGKLIHHIHALYLQMHLYSRLTHYDKAIAAHSVLKKLYRPDRHSEGLRKIYGSDSGALSTSLAAYIHLVRGDRRQATRLCRFVLKDIVPAIESDYDQAFSLALPLILVLKETGRPLEAQQVFDALVLDRFNSSTGKRPSVVFILKPLSMLLALSSGMTMSEDKLQEVTHWACNADSLRFDCDANRRMSRFGTCANSIKAEICLKLAEKLPDSVQRNVVIAYGTVAAANAVTFNRKNLLKMTMVSAQRLQTRLKNLGGTPSKLQNLGSVDRTLVYV